MSGQAQADVQERINTYWTVRSKSYDESPGHGLRNDAERQAWAGALGALLPPPPNDVLDVGTGTGFLALLANDLGHRATGVDLSEGMLAFAKKKAAQRDPAPRFLIGDAVAPDFEPGSFDAVVSRHVLWTLRDPEAAFANWYRLLRPGGRVVIIDSLWFLDEEKDEEQASELQSEVARLWAECYGAETRAALPILQASSVEPVMALLRNAGFEGVTTQPLEGIAEAEARPETSEKDSRYVIAAVRPQG